MAKQKTKKKKQQKEKETMSFDGGIVSPFHPMMKKKKRGK